MPNSPSVRFETENNNVQTSLPTLGITAVVARTTKGPFNQPDTILRNLSQFSDLYGKELVPDGTTSNIERAFAMGSMLRVSRVAGSTALAKGVAKVYNVPTSTAEAENAVLTIEMLDPDDATNKATFGLEINTKEYGSSIVDPSVQGSNKNFFLQILSTISGSNLRYYFTQFKKYNGAAPQDGSVIDQRLMLSTSIDGSTSYTDGSSIESFIRMVPNLEFLVMSSNVASVKNIEDLISYIKLHPEFRTYIKTEVALKDNTAVADYIINEGNNGGVSTKETWLEAYEAHRNYVDTYQLILSHIHQHIPDAWEPASQSVANLVKKDFENMLYVEVPKTDSDGKALTPTEIVLQANSMMSSIGSNKSIAYFCGGLKFYGSNGALQNNDVLGTIVGLGDYSATKYGPWLSFSGMNRGLVPDAIGPVMKNLGSPALYDELNTLAMAHLNLFVIKDTPTAGRQTMLWHGFTSEVLNNSNRFIASVRLQLYLKKNLRPIMERYLEEPNYIPAWLNIYYEVKDILDTLVPDAMSEYTWHGDQFATSYRDMQINKEADVRQGKYKAKLVYKDVVSMQEVTVTLAVDSVTRDITIQ